MANVAEGGSAADQGGIWHAYQLQQRNDPADLDIVEITDIEEARLLALAQRRRGNRIMFFNSPDGIKLRLHVHPHNQRQLSGTPKYCCLCGSGDSGSKRHRTTFKCTGCDAHLCARAHPGQRKSCWSIWHESRRLNVRDQQQILAERTRTDDTDQTTLLCKLVTVDSMAICITRPLRLCGLMKRTVSRW
jgi:hypothetical protein